jgi:GGDEF domain-containing protein
VNLSGWSDEGIYLPIVIAAVALLLTAWFGTIIANQVRAVNLQLEHDQGLIDDLRIRDPQTGLMRYAYAQQTLKNEIGRSRRNNSSLCLILGQVVDWENIVNQQGIVAAEDIKVQIADIFNNTLRMVDTTFIAGAYGAILPDTKPDGALVVARRLSDLVARKSRVDLRIGISQFPADGVTEQELQKASEIALQQALTTEHTIALYSQIPEMRGENAA